MKEQFGEHAGAGPRRDFAIHVGGETDRRPITDDDLGLYIDVPTAYDEALQGEHTFGTFRGLGRAATKEEKGGDSSQPPLKHHLDVIDLEEERDNDGYDDPLSRVTVREQRVAKARRIFGLKSQRSRGDQADQAAAEDHSTTVVNKVLQSPHHPEQSAARKALHRLHVKLYHYETERLQPLLGAVGASVEACNPVPAVVQACQACRPWRRPGQSNRFTFSLALSFQEKVQLDLLFYRSALQPGLGREKRDTYCSCNRLLNY